MRSLSFITRISYFFNLEKSKIALEQQNLDLQRTVYAAFTAAKGALNANESATLVTIHNVSFKSN